jgi:hypothetical protein
VNALNKLNCLRMLSRCRVGIIEVMCSRSASKSLLRFKTRTRKEGAVLSKVRIDGTLYC